MTSTNQEIWFRWEEYEMIVKFYGTRTAARSGVPLINHIHEGLELLLQLGASRDAMRAYCLHPLLQSDIDLATNVDSFYWCHVVPSVLILAMEYRNIANQYLSHRTISDISEISLSPLPQVNLMLVADKVQNRKDFLVYHYGTHARSDVLDQYFKNWLSRLQISDTDYHHLVEGRYTKRTINTDD